MTQTPSIKEALELLQKAEANYRSCVKWNGHWDGRTTLAWNALKEAGDKARAALATLQPPGERREAIARHNQELALGFCKASFQKRFNLSDSRTEEYAECIADVLNMATDFASGFVQNEAGIRADTVSVPKEPTREILDAIVEECKAAWSFGNQKVKPIPMQAAGVWREVARPFYRAMLNASIRSARDGGEG